MNRGKRTLVAGVLALALALGAAAAAQQTDTTLQRYDLAIQNLDQAVAAVPSDSAQARNDLDHAVNALVTLSHETTSATLVKAMDGLFDRARAAVGNQSRTDIAVQAAVLSGGFQRLVMDAAFKAAVAGDMATAKARLAHIGADMHLDQGALDGIKAAGTPAALRLQTEQGVARLISEDVSVARRLLNTDRGVAYQTLAEAYGASLLVQDSPRANSAFNQQFVDAAKALVAMDDSAFQTAAQALTASAGRLAEADRQALASTGAPQTAAAPSAAAAPAALPSVSPGSGTTASTPAQTQAQAPAAGNAGGSASAGTEGAGQATQATLADLAAQQRQQQLDALTKDIVKTGMAAPAAQHLASRYLDAGITTLQDATQAVLSPTARAAASLLSGDAARARDQVETAAQRYDTLLSPIVGFTEPAVDAATRTAFADTSALVGLRLQDLDNLTAQVDAAARAVNGEPQPANLALNRSIDAWWAGWPRLVVLLVFGILAFIPLYLLNLAFGGGNRNWQLIGVALFLLLLPVVYEALAALGSMVAKWTDNDAFNVLASYSMFQSTIGQVVWAALMVLAILFAISGLYGICVQFGLLGRGKRAGGPGATVTATTTSTGSRESGEAMVDWDEEF